MYQGIYKDHIYIDRKEAITQMKKKRTFNVDFSDRKLNERPHILRLYQLTMRTCTCVL